MTRTALSLLALLILPACGASRNDHGAPTDPIYSLVVENRGAEQVTLSVRYTVSWYENGGTSTSLFGESTEEPPVRRHASYWDVADIAAGTSLTRAYADADPMEVWVIRQSDGLILLQTQYDRGLFATDGNSIEITVIP